VIEANRGAGFAVRRGQVFRIVCLEGPQIADIAIWNASDAKDRLNAARTMLLEGWFIERDSRIWSEIPKLHPLATCLGDSVNTTHEEEGWHHHFVLNHCTPEYREMQTGRAGLNACHLNLLEGMKQFDLDEDDMSDCIAAHQKARIDQETGMFIFAPTDSDAGDYVEFYAEIDLNIAVSVCPGGDGHTLEQIPENVTIRSLGVEIFDTGIEPLPFPVWTDWRT
jgi:uncharacterized protein YcgI (DUF1989 family)